MWSQSTRMWWCVYFEFRNAESSLQRCGWLDDQLQLARYYVNLARLELLCELHELLLFTLLLLLHPAQLLLLAAELLWRGRKAQKMSIRKLNVPFDLLGVGTRNEEGKRKPKLNCGREKSTKKMEQTEMHSGKFEGNKSLHKNSNFFSVCLHHARVLPPRKFWKPYFVQWE